MSDKEVEELKEKLRTLEESPFGVHFDPVELLQECLYHSDRDIRVKAIRLAGSFPNSDFIEPLFRIIAEGDDLEVRVAGIETLGNYLHKGQMADYDVDIPEDELDEEVREVMAETRTMNGIDQTQFSAIRDFLGELTRQIEWPVELRAEALPHYAKLAPEEAKSLIEKFYRSEKVPLQKAALRAIGRISSGDWDRLLKQEVSSSGDPERRIMAIEAAGIHGVEEIGPDLVSILRDNNKEELRQAAADALGRIPWSEAGEYLSEFSEDRDPLVRQYINEGLIRRDDSSDVEDINTDPSRFQ